jgi:TonB family protein
MHGVAVGSVAELAGFLTALDADKHLAMDFWAVMGKMSNESSAYLAGSTLNERMLEVVVEAVTGSSLAEVITSSEESLGVVERLSRLLSGEDINSPVVVDHAPGAEDPDVELKKPVSRADMPSLTAMPSPGSAGPTPVRLFRSRADDVERAPVEMRPAHRFDERRAEERPAAAQPIARTPGSGTEAPGPRPVTARAVFSENPSPIRPGADATEDELALERLRLMRWALENFPAPNNSAAMRAEAELIGAKLSAAELMAKYGPRNSQAEAAPRDPVAERPADATAADQSVVPAVPFWKLQEPVSIRIEGESRRMVPEPKLEGLAQPEVALRGADDDGPPIHIPLSDFEDDDLDANQKMRIFGCVIGGVMVIGVAIGLLLGYTNGMWQSVTAPIREIHSSFWHRPVTALDVPNDLVVDPPPPPPPEPVPVHRARVAPTPTPTREIPAKARMDHRIDQRMDQPIVRVLPAPSDRLVPATGATDPVQAENRPTVSAAYPDTARSSGGAVVPVPASAMVANLLISRPPVYPDAARASHAEGQVLMQVVVNKDGTVGHIHVLEGDPVLRSAAAEAVSKWRYRPYQVNGQPVEVSTTVAVNFTVDQ